MSLRGESFSEPRIESKSFSTMDTGWPLIPPQDKHELVLDCIKLTILSDFQPGLSTGIKIIFLGTLPVSLIIALSPTWIEPVRPYSGLEFNTVIAPFD